MLVICAAKSAAPLAISAKLLRSFVIFTITPPARKLSIMENILLKFPFIKELNIFPNPSPIAGITLFTTPLPILIKPSRILLSAFSIPLFSSLSRILDTASPKLEPILAEPLTTSPILSTTPFKPLPITSSAGNANLSNRICCTFFNPVPNNSISFTITSTVVDIILLSFIKFRNAVIASPILAVIPKIPSLSPNIFVTSVTNILATPLTTWPTISNIENTP